MTKNERPDVQEENTELVDSGTQDMVPVEVREPQVPKGLSDKESQVLKSRAIDLVKQLEDASGSQQLELSDSITNLGVQAQRGAGAELDLLRTRVGEMMTQDGPGGQISGDLVDLRAALNQINPHEIGRVGFMGNLLAKFPFVGSPALRALEKIAIRYEPVSNQVSVIETKLREGRAMLARDNVELRMLYEQVETQQLPVQKNAYMGELVMLHPLGRSG